MNLPGPAVERADRAESGGELPSEGGPVTGGFRAWRSVPVAGLALLLLAIGVSLRFPVYFHWDDVSYLRWVQTHSNPLDVLRPHGFDVYGTFRPLLMLTWWILYRVFSLHAIYYQIFLTLLYALSFVVYLHLLRFLYSWRIAAFGLVGYMAVFLPLEYIIFWFSDLTFVLELLFLNLSLLHLLRAANDESKSPFSGLLFFVCSILTKEPSALIITAVLAAYSWARWPVLAPALRRRIRWMLPAIVGTSILWLALSPTVHSRQGVAGLTGVADLLRFAAFRWRFYAENLLGRTGLLIVLAAFFLCARSLLRRREAAGGWGWAVALLLAAVLSLALKPFAALALLLVLAACVICALRRREVAVPVVWGFVPLLGLLTLAFYVKTYLTEASFGFAALLAVAAEEVFRSLPRIRRPRTSRVARVALGLLVAAGVVFFAAASRGKLAALQVLSDSRQNFRDVSLYLSRNPLPANARLAAVAYTDMDLNYVSDVRTMDIGAKVTMQKTMEPYNLPDWFCIQGRSDIQVIQSMRDYLEARVDSCYVWVMNNHENRYLDHLQLRRKLLYEVHRRGEGSWLYLTWRPAASEADTAGPPRSSRPGSASSAARSGR